MIKNSNQDTENKISLNARVLILDALHNVGGGHFGGALSSVEILQALLTSCKIGQRVNTTDYLILSKGHAAVAYYALLDALGHAQFRHDLYGESSYGLEVHPCMGSNDWVHFSSGSLGQGLSIGLGIAFALRDQTRNVWVVLGDGECQEGQIWEAAGLAARYRLSNLHVIVDCNSFQECGWQSNLALRQEALPEAEEKWRAFGWIVETINGHSLEELCDWIVKVSMGNEKGPSVAIAQTIKGAGVSYFEQQPEHSHYCSLKEEDYLAMRELLCRE